MSGSRDLAEVLGVKDALLGELRSKGPSGFLNGEMKEERSLLTFTGDSSKSESSVRKRSFATSVVRLGLGGVVWNTALSSCPNLVFSSWLLCSTFSKITSTFSAKASLELLEGLSMTTPLRDNLIGDTFLSDTSLHTSP